MGQRKWLWRVEEPPPPRKRGKNKRRAVVSSLDGQVRGGEEKRGKKVNADVLINGRNFKILT